MTSPNRIDPGELRAALGSFATGITIVTTRQPAGADVGLTANSFNSVSLNPPLVLWSLAKTSHSQPAFAAADYFAVHILAADQEEQSNRFSKKGADKFEGQALERGHGGIPLLTGCAARFQCRTAFRYEGGDHDIFVGEVIAFEHFERQPLIFHKGRYGVVAARTGMAAGSDDASFLRNFLGFLLGEAHFKLFDAIRQELRRLQISLDQYFAICALGAGARRTAAELDEMAGFYDRAFKSDAALDLLARGLVEGEAEGTPSSRLRLTARGHALMIELLAVGKSAEADAMESFDFAEVRLLRSLLKRLVKAKSLNA